MIPSVSSLFERELTFGQRPTLTYKMHLDDGRISGRADGIAAMKQAIYKILLTERYAYVMYSWGYGIETRDLYGQPVSFVCTELERRITEALTHDKRITGVSDFTFDTSKRGAVSASFTVHTVFGDTEAERTVNV